MNTTVCIPVRRGSERVKRKNLRPFTDVLGVGQFNLLSWKLTILLKVFDAEQVLVSTDWDLAAETAAEFGVRVHERSPSLATSDAPFHLVIEEVAQQVETEHIMWAPVTAPFVGPIFLRYFLAHYEEMAQERQGNGQILVQTARSYGFLGGVPVNFALGENHLQTQDLPPLELMSWQLAIRRTRDVLRDRYMFAIPSELVSASTLEALDIDDMLDFEMAQALVPLFLEQEPEAL